MQKILSIIESIAHEKNISVDNAMEAFKEALANTAKRLVGEEGTYEVEIDPDEQNYHIYKVLTVVPDDDPRLEEDPESYIPMEEAVEYDPDIEPGDQIRSEIHLEEYGRTAAANLFQELEYHIQRRIEQDLFEKYKSRVGSIIIGTVSRVDDAGNTYVEIGELSGILSQRNRIKGESFKTGDTLKALLRFVTIDPKYGMYLELTRTSPKFLEALMKREVPEIQDGAVEIVSAARIPGERAKVALKSDRPDIDPIGAAVGQRGVRINAVSAELCGENIDCIEYSPIPEIFITRALSPAIVQSVRIENNNTADQKAIVDITADQKAKAIGKSGINIRLASMLTKYQIELNEVEGVTERAPEAGKNQEKTKDLSALENLFK
ncbi:transcription termination factor NusA [Nitratifractor sp.]|uniref:transcription termination factor NusA n=1 Tax=Nitratifractor sp. TaxID=2268144 RepID=UPI0025F5289E|nr:transcription termination factor NusA [Nitratifractor sp.]